MFHKKRGLLALLCGSLAAVGVYVGILCSRREEITTLSALTPTATSVPEITLTPSPTLTDVPEATPMSVPEATPMPVSVSEKKTVSGKEWQDMLCRELKTEERFLKEQSLQREILTRKEAFLALYEAALSAGITADEELLKTLRERERIADLGGNEEENKAMYWLLAVGLVEGRAEKAYSRERLFEPEEALSYDDALCYGRRLTDKEARRKLTPDGQVIRTEKLPRFAEYYPYILDSFPNEFYGWEFHFMKWTNDNGNPLFETDIMRRREDYYAPCDMSLHKKELTNGVIPADFFRQYGETLAKKAEQYLYKIFSVDYRTIEEDLEWYHTVLTLDAKYGTENQEKLEQRMQMYIELMKENHTILECDFVAAEPSAVYMDSWHYYIRAYVRYRIVSSDSMEQVRYSPVAYTNMNFAHYSSVTLGEWRDGYFDVEVEPEGEGSIIKALIADWYYEVDVLPETKENGGA